jgi:hypothetical protein
MPAKTQPAPPEPALVGTSAVHLAHPGDPEGFPLHMPDAADEERVSAIVAREALRWTYVLRSRRRWVGDSRARERNEEDAQRALQAIGVDKDKLAALVKGDRAVVRVPWTGEESKHWESRIFPWEYVLTAATRRDRLAGSLDANPKPLTVMRELVMGTPATPPPPDRATLFAGGLRLLFVECLPSELREHWNLAPEQERLSAALAGVGRRHGAPACVADACRAVRGGQGLATTVHPLRRAGQPPGAARVARPTRALTRWSIWVRRAIAPQPGAHRRRGVPLPHGLQRVADVTADSRLMVDGLLLRGESQTSPRTQGAMQVAAAAQAGGTGRGARHARCIWRSRGAAAAKLSAAGAGPRSGAGAA